MPPRSPTWGRGDIWLCLTMGYIWDIYIYIHIYIYIDPKYEMGIYKSITHISNENGNEIYPHYLIGLLMYVEKWEQHG